jgi:Na+-driven multidrug efflux pump
MAELTAQAIVMLFTLACITRLPPLSLSNIWFYRDHLLTAWRKALNLGWPIALRWMNEMLALAIVAIFIGYLGSNALSGFRVVSQLDLLVLMIPYSMNIILALLLAQSKQQVIFNKTFSISLSITLILIFICSLAFWLYPKWLLIHCFDLSTQKPQLLKLSVKMLMITGLGQLFNACRQICNAALRALDDTLWPFIFSLISYWGIAVLGSWLCIHYENHSMIMIWWCVNGAYILACLLSILRLCYYLSSK